MELRSWRTWLRPGMLIKRWILLAMIGIIVISLGLAMGLTWAYRNLLLAARRHLGRCPFSHTPIHSTSLS